MGDLRHVFSSRSFAPCIHSILPSLGFVFALLSSLPPHGPCMHRLMFPKTKQVVQDRSGEGFQTVCVCICVCVSPGSRDNPAGSLAGIAHSNQACLHA